MANHGQRLQNGCSQLYDSLTPTAAMASGPRLPTIHQGDHLNDTLKAHTHRSREGQGQDTVLQPGGGQIGRGLLDAARRVWVC